MTEKLPEPLVPPEIDLRDTAAAAGHRRYFTGKACPAGHFVERYTLNGYCVACQGEINRADRSRIRGLLRKGAA
jgi:hypothetical protein